jgi:membrane protease YdiL (CAAX protease family)
MLDDAPKQATILESAGLSSGQQSGDKFSTWSIILVVIVVAMQLFFNDGEALVKKVAPQHHEAADATLSTADFEKLLRIDSAVKQAYAESMFPPALIAALEAQQKNKTANPGGSGTTLNPFHSTISDALYESLSALRGSPDGTYFARRVIILRMVLNQPPFAAIPATRSEKGLSSPLQSFDIVAAEHPEMAALAKREESFWANNFTASQIPSSQLPSHLLALNQYPTLLFYSLIARQQLFLKAGQWAEAKRAEYALQQRSLLSLAGIVAISLVIVALLLFGCAVLIGSIASRMRSAKQARLLTKVRDADGDVGTPAPAVEMNTPDIFSRFVRPLPRRITDADRKLRAGDLFDCFAVYLVSLTGVGTLLELLAALIPKEDIAKLTVLQITYVEIGFALAGYIGASAIALAFLFSKATKRQASLKTELGMTTDKVGSNILYGAAGWGAALVIMMVISTVAEKLLHALPAPENPALPMLSFAPNTLSRLSLYTLAAVAAPYFEETFFRGVLLNAFLLRFKPGWACLLVGLMFGGIHPVGVVEALSLATLGTVFAWMAYIRKSLAPSMFAHFLQNSFAYMSVYLSFSIILRI